MSTNISWSGFNRKYVFLFYFMFSCFRVHKASVLVYLLILSFLGTSGTAVMYQIWSMTSLCKERVMNKKEKERKHNFPSNSSFYLNSNTNGVIVVTFFWQHLHLHWSVWVCEIEALRPLSHKNKRGQAPPIRFEPQKRSSPSYGVWITKGIKPLSWAPNTLCVCCQRTLTTFLTYQISREKMRKW